MEETIMEKRLNDQLLELKNWLEFSFENALSDNDTEHFYAKPLIVILNDRPITLNLTKEAFDNLTQYIDLCISTNL